MRSDPGTIRGQGEEDIQEGTLCSFQLKIFFLPFCLYSEDCLPYAAKINIDF